MSQRTNANLSSADCERIAARVRDELSGRRLTRAGLAHDARISLSTLEKALAGRRPFTRTTVIRIESALGLNLRDAASSTQSFPPTTGAVAADEYGCYARSAVAHLVGAYLTLRPSFAGDGSIYAYRTVIAWDDVENRLGFVETDRKDADFTQRGAVTVPHQTGHVYFVTNRHGQYRLVVLSRPTIQGEMHGLLTTLQVVQGAHMIPVSMPIALAPLQTAPAPVFGTITADCPAYPGYRVLLDRALGERFAGLIK